MRADRLVPADGPAADGDEPGWTAEPVGPSEEGHHALVDGHRRWSRRLHLAVALAGLLVFGGLSLLCRMLAEENEQRLLEEQTGQIGAVLAGSIGQVRAPLDGAARAAAATAGDPATFERVVQPLLGAEGGYRSLVLYDAASGAALSLEGAAPRLTAGEDEAQTMLRSARDEPFVVVDLLPHQTLGFAVADGDDPPRYVVYAERLLRPDTNATRRTDEPFSQLEYALYLDAEDPGQSLGASVAQLPITGQRATVTVPLGDHELVVVTSPIGRLGGRLMADLWWLVLVGGAFITGAVTLLVHRLQRVQSRAVALAADNARKHLEQREIAEVLQRGLLPERLAPPPRASIAARYWPAGHANLVGGDFYDAFRIDDHRWALVIGDVCGKGIEAAALTGLVRHTIRTASRADTAPSEVLRAVHTAVREHEPATFCTVCLVICRADDPDADRSAPMDVTVALGGHPRPLLARDGDVMPIGHPGTVLGMVEPTIVDERIDVRPGDTLVLFTDGLTDAPAEQRVTTEELAELLRQETGTGVEQLADLIGMRKRARRPSGSSDDTAIVVVRFGDHAGLQAVPVGAPERPGVARV